MPRKHKYETLSTWTGDRGQGTADYRSYARTYDTASPGRPPIPGSSDPAFRGDAERWNPELLVRAAQGQYAKLGETGLYSSSWFPTADLLPCPRWFCSSLDTVRSQQGIFRVYRLSGKYMRIPNLPTMGVPKVSTGVLPTCIGWLVRSSADAKTW